jgi:hypothetical protein
VVPSLLLAAWGKPARRGQGCPDKRGRLVPEFLEQGVVSLLCAGHGAEVRVVVADRPTRRGGESGLRRRRPRLGYPARGE